MDKKSRMLAIKNEIIENEALPLYRYRKQNFYHPVIGVGDHDTQIVFVGEAPGENEAKTGFPFCGAAGKVLDKLLSEIAIERKSVYITNIVKDRPPDNRDPLPSEIAAYSPYLLRQLEIIKPKIIVTLGRHAMNYLLQLFELPQEGVSISLLHGKPIDLLDYQYAQKLLPLFHPAVALYSPSQKAVLSNDFQVLKRLLE